MLLRHFVSKFIVTSCRQCSSNTSTKSITIAMIGSPNAGKSTLINQIVGAKVSAVSSIAHTTRSYANGVLTLDDTQLIFTDTPGTVSYHQGRRLNMTSFHIRAPSRVASSADILAVVKDVSSRKTKDYIDETLLDILKENSSIPSILILNKVDLVKRKENLLFLSTILSNDRQKDQWGYLDHGGYSNFEKVFMVSAKSGDGVNDLIDYFVSKAKNGVWYYSKDIYSDSSIQKQISEVSRETLLSLFAEEIPWKVKQETVLFHAHENIVRIHHKLTWPKKSQQRYVATKRGQIVYQCTKELEDMFQTPVQLTIDISQKDKMTKDDLIMY